MFVQTIASCPVDLSERAIYERGERETKDSEEKREGERKIHIVPLVTRQLHSRSSNLFACAHAIEEETRPLSLSSRLSLINMVNFLDEVSTGSERYLRHGQRKFIR